MDEGLHRATPDTHAASPRSQEDFGIIVFRHVESPERDESHEPFNYESRVTSLLP